MKRSVNDIVIFTVKGRFPGRFLVSLTRDGDSPLPVHGLVAPLKKARQSASWLALAVGCEITVYLNYVITDNLCEACGDP